MFTFKKRRNAATVAPTRRVRSHALDVLQSVSADFTRYPQPANSPAVRRDVKTLAIFISLYCDQRHAGRVRSPFVLKDCDLHSIMGRDVALCPKCSKLLAHAVIKRLHCPMNPKPACKRCPQHCYSPAYRRAMKTVMRYSGRELLLSGRIDFLFHFLF